MTPPLSPQAQAVMSRSQDECPYVPAGHVAAIAAAALRAATLNVFFKETLGMTAYGGYDQALEKILAIADELEAWE